MNAYPTTETLVRAVEIIRAQGYTPMSPCSVDEQGNLHLCAAAAVAAAGLQLYLGEEARLDFEQSLAESHEMAMVEKAFERLGWDKSICNQVLQRNNSFHDAERTSRVAQMLSDEFR